MRLGYWMLACVAVLPAPHWACGACLVRLKTLGGRPFYVPVISRGTLNWKDQGHDLLACISNIKVPSGFPKTQTFR